VIEPTDEMRMVAYRDAREWAAVHGHQQPDDRMIDDVLTAVLAVVFRPDPHLYLSTGCLHDTEEGHAYCRVEARRYDGSTKTAATCKFGECPCVCPCHREAS
jgi:hypothetical protein